MLLDKTAQTFSVDEGMIVLIDKPLEWSSFHVVKRIRNVMCKKLRRKKVKVGHAGTLDPLASGLLIICIGKATKKIVLLQDAMKTYTGTFFIGATTPSYDLEMEVDQTFPIDHISEEMIQDAAASFQGLQMQVPPVFSALKKDGKRAYKLARQGKEVDLPKRPVLIEKFEVNGVLPNIDFEVICTKGTYIRSLAFDYGVALQSGAYLSRLRRTAIGDYHVNDAWQINDFVEFVENANI